MAKTKQTKRMMTMALAAAVVMSSVPTVAFAEEINPANEPAAEQPAGNTVTTEVTATGTGNVVTGETGDNGSVTTKETETDSAGNVVKITITENEKATETETITDNSGKEAGTATEIVTTTETTTIVTDDGTGEQTSTTVTAAPGETDTEVVGTTEVVSDSTKHSETTVGKGQDKEYITDENTAVETKETIDREVTLEVNEVVETKETVVVEEVALTVKTQADAVKHTSNADKDQTNDVYTTDLKIEVTVDERTGNTYVNVYAGNTPIASQKVEGDTVEFTNLELQENQNIDIKLENVGFMKNGEGVIVQTEDIEKVTSASDEIK
ncbi:MAG: hypothetical protein IKU21_04375, partial [Anaerotignum sp.]|nr:hypothetical protein [Anaerotignum sp.]